MADKKNRSLSMKDGDVVLGASSNVVIMTDPVTGKQTVAAVDDVTGRDIVSESADKSFVELPNPDHPEDALGMLASMQSELENKVRKKQYLEQKISNLESRKALTTDKDVIVDCDYKITCYLLEIKQLDTDIDRIRSHVKKMSDSISQKTHYDKDLVLRNIRYLLSSSTIKLGQIEREARGCQPGYLSRLERNTTEPSLEFIVTVAVKLGVSMDLLLHTDLTQITKTEQYIIDFLGKLEKDTNDEKLKWEARTASDLNNPGLTKEMEPDHELFGYYVDDPDNPEVPLPTPEILFLSHSFGYNTRITGDCYSLKMKNNTVLYLMDIEGRKHGAKGSEKTRALEVWMTQKGKGKSFVCSTLDHNQIRITLINLYKAVEEWNKHPQVKDYLRSVIDDFMNDDLST